MTANTSRMDASRIQARAVFKVVAIVLVALGIAMLLEHVVVEVRTTIRWLADPGRAAAFCGASRDPEPSSADLSFLPAPRAEGASCREKTAAWLARARRAGLTGRTAVGVAWDGERFVWHAWAEVRLERGWVPVDPSFGELPARGPRFTLAVYEDGDAVARRRAGERILPCWATERVR